MKAGAVDFLTKPVASGTLLTAISNALRVDAEWRKTAQRTRLLRERYDRLTMREREVFALVSRGLLNKQVAARLAVTERTIKAHRREVMHKMGVSSFADLVRAADQFDDQSYGDAGHGESRRRG